MITIAEYRAWAEESLKWAGEATTANQRDAYIKLAEVWLQSDLRGERFSKEPIPTTEYEWVLSPFSNRVTTLQSNEKVLLRPYFVCFLCWWR